MKVNLKKNDRVWTCKLAIWTALAVAMVTGNGNIAQAQGDTRGYSVSQTFSTVGSTSEPGEPLPMGMTNPVWYAYQSPLTGTLSFNTSGSSFANVVAVYTGPGNSFSTLVMQGAAASPNSVTINVTTNTIYWIEVGGLNGATGTVQLSIQQVLPPFTVGSCVADTMWPYRANQPAAYYNQGGQYFTVVSDDLTAASLSSSFISVNGSPYQIGLYNSQMTAAPSSACQAPPAGPPAGSCVADTMWPNRANQPAAYYNQGGQYFIVVNSNSTAANLSSNHILVNGSPYQVGLYDSQVTVVSGGLCN